MFNKVICTAAVMAALGTSALATEKMRISLQLPLTSHLGQNLSLFEKEVEARTNGAIDVEIYDSAQLYKDNCVRCHGETGHGDGPDAALLKEQLGVVPTNFHRPAFKAKDRQEIHKAIAEGGGAVGLSDAMPPWSSLFEDKEIQALTDYVRSMPEE